MNENQDITDYKRAYEAAMAALRMAQAALVQAERIERLKQGCIWPFPYTNPQPHCCPVCNGSGKQHPNYNLTPTTALDPCHACGGRGIVWSQP